MFRGFGEAISAFTEDYARTRVAFIAVTFALTAFGIMMIYSASSISALVDKNLDYNSTYYLFNQAKYAVVGIVAAAIIAFVDYHMWSRTFLIPIWAGTVVLLLLVLMPGVSSEAGGATRWITIFGGTLQPSEFAKVTVLLVAANLIEHFYEGYASDYMRYLLRCFVLLGVPLLLILAQPDKGTVMILGLTVLVMLIVAGIPLRWVGLLGAGGFLVIAGLALRDSYSRARILTMLDPWRDEFEEGYQLIQGFYSFGTGGLLGVGLGMSRQKYNYLPMAHNDFIFAVIGEEFGLVGTVSLLFTFFVLVWLGFKIARSAPDLSGQLIASGAVSLLGIQLLVNVCGVLGMIPLSGKPIPFISYGGSSIIATLMLAGMVVSVSRASQGARRTGNFTVHEGGGRQGSRSSGLRLVQGGARMTPEDMRFERDFTRDHADARVSYNANGSRRINLGPSASDRLRSRDQGRGRRR